MRVRDQGENVPPVHRYLARGDGLAVSSWSPAAALARWRQAIRSGLAKPEERRDGD